MKRGEGHTTAALRIVSVSGGKDSTALYLWAVDQFGPEGFRAVFADTGHEHPVTLNYVLNLHLLAKGPKVEWVKADYGDRLRARGKWPSGVGFLDMWMFKGRAPSAAAQFCTEELKLKPIKFWLERVRGDREVIMYVGLRAGESAKRALKPPSEFNELYDCEVYYPLLKWSEAEVFAFLAAHGVEPNPLYANGSARVGCYPCIHSRKSELASLEDWAWEKLATWEKLGGRTFAGFGDVPLTADQQQAMLGARGNKELTAQLKDAFSPTADVLREWASTARGGRQHEMFTEDAKDVPSCMGTWGACE